MGAGIAQAFIENGIHVRLFSRNRSRLNDALEQIEFRQSELVRKRAMSSRVAERSKKFIDVTTALDEAVRDVDFVSENIVERQSEKKKLFKKLGDWLPEDVMLSTNTSSLSLAPMASVVKFPERFIGLHWMNPAHLMPIVEVVRAPETSDSTVHATCELAKRLGKSPIVVNEDISGFVINRLQYALFREAYFLVQKGIIGPSGIDDALKDGLGLRWAILGAFEHMDLSGLDTVQAVAGSLFKDLDRTTTPPPMLTKLVKAGNLGLKTGGGFNGWPRADLEQLANRRDDALIEILRFLRRLRKKPSDPGNPTSAS